MFNDPLIPGKTVGIVSGRYDEVIPFSDVLDFSRLWETRSIRGIDHGHFSLMYFCYDLFEHIFDELGETIRSIPEWI